MTAIEKAIKRENENYTGSRGRVINLISRRNTEKWYVSAGHEIYCNEELPSHVARGAFLVFFFFFFFRPRGAVSPRFSLYTYVRGKKRKKSSIVFTFTCARAIRLTFRARGKVKKCIPGKVCLVDSARKKFVKEATVPFDLLVFGRFTFFLGLQEKIQAASWHPFIYRGKGWRKPVKKQTTG